MKTLLIAGLLLMPVSFANTPESYESADYEIYRLQKDIAELEETVRQLKMKVNDYYYDLDMINKKVQNLEIEVIRRGTIY